MSGIAGIVHFDGRPVEPGQIAKMTNAMDYRGPDGIHHWAQGSIALGQCMLRTTPESLEETQPLANEDGSLVLVMDGRLDNWEELRRELLRHGARLRTRADAELLLRAYEAWGERCVEHLDGDFAFAMWNARQNILFCARDRVGNKQFHFHWNGSSFAFATDLHPVLDLPWVPESVDENTVAEYLATDWLTIDTTLWQGIKRLKPAHHMTISGQGKLTTTEYWAPDPFATLPYTSDSEYIEHYLELFTDVVRRTLRSHRPLAIEVSGGLDSSSIFATAMRLQSEGRLPAPSLSGYTLDFSGDPDANELNYALQVGQHHGNPIQIVQPTYMPLTWYADRACRFRNFPDSPNGVAMRQIEITRILNAGSRVLVGGSGGDEWADGSGMHYAESLAEYRLREIGQHWRAERELFDLRTTSARFLRQGVLPLLPESTKKLLRAVRTVAIKRTASQKDWLGPALRRRLESTRDTVHRSPRRQLARPGQRWQWALLHEAGWQIGKEMNERNLAWHGLEWRQPFWHRRVIECAFAMPDHLLRRLGQSKWILRQAMQNLLPESVRLRKDKAEFGITFKQHWPDLGVYLQESALSRRAAWIRRIHLESLFNEAFTADSGWNEGPIWMFFGLDTFLPAVGHS